VISAARNQIPLARAALVSYMTTNCTSISDWQTQKTRTTVLDEAVARIEFTVVEPYKNDGSDGWIKVFGNIVFLLGTKDKTGQAIARNRDAAHDEAWRIIYDIWNARGHGANCGGYYLDWEGQPVVLMLGAKNTEGQQIFVVEADIPISIKIRIPLNPSNQKHLVPELGV
jgi:hypothetical protein